MNQVLLEGPCKGPIELQIQAILKAPTDPNAIKTGEWLTVNKLDFFTMSGGGTLDGQGKEAWECKKSKKCTKLPNVSFVFLFDQTFKIYFFHEQTRTNTIFVFLFWCRI